jgi:NAD(P)H-dependent glutamate synthase small subunit
VSTDYGPKMDTDLSACVADGSCERVGACSAFEKVTVKRKRPPKTRVPELGLDDIPEPAKQPIERIWRGCLVGVGGMGIGLATSILVRAGHKEGYPVVFLDKKGLAIRNGGVVSQIVYNPAEQPVTAIIPYGKADLLLGVDVLEAARALDPTGRSRIASRDQTAAVINTTKVQTIAGIMGREDFDPDALVEMIRQHTREKDFLAKDISRICEKYLGSRLYSNVMMIGFAFQKGLIPVSMHSMAWAIKDTIRADFRKNLYAFNMGRKLCEDQSLFQGAPQRTGWKDTLEEKCRYTIRRYATGQNLADQLRELVTRTLDSMGDLDAALKRDVVVRTYDCLRWGGLDYARTYASKVAAVYADDSAEFGHQATQAVIHNLARAMLIKDGVFIAELSTSPEKYARDREKYNINPAHGDRALYRHLWNVDLRLFGKRKQLDLTLPDWSLKAFKRMRWLRKALPGWHSWDRKYRETYLKKVDAFAYASMDEYRRQVGRLSASQCMNCMNPRCAETGCPLASRVPEWMQLADQGRWKQAADVLHEDNNFPEFTARICPAFCQESCKKNITDFPVQVQQMEEEIIDRAWKEGWITPRPASAKTGKHVAVVGSGPAGLAAAQQLARAGHQVTVFEREDRPGGLLRYGIPGVRLDKALIDRRVEQLSGEGVTFRTGVRVGQDTAASELREQYDAVLLAVGATLPRDLDVPGRSSPGVHFALDYLRQGAALPAPPAGKYVSESAELTARDKVVAVIGGGLTGLDCVETAVQQGAKQVVQLEILPKTAAKSAGGNGHPLPSGPIEQKWCVSTKAFQTNGGNHLSEIRACEVEWEHSPAGPVMKEKPDSEFVVPADLALLAVGFEPKVDKPLAQQLGLADDDGRIRVDRCATDVEGIFAAGDVVTGPAYVATAIDSGRRAARRICEYLQD